MRKTAFLLIFSVILSIFLTGCWDMKEINSRAYVLGLGMDATSEDGVFLFTFQRAIPAGIDSPASSNSIKYENISVKAQSLAQAVRTLTMSSSMEFSFAHLSCVIIGNELAHQSFSVLLEYLMQQTDVRRQCIVAISSDTAQSLLEYTPLTVSSSVGTASLLEELDHSRGHTVIMTLSDVSIAALTGRGYCIYSVGQQPDITSSEPGVSSSDTGGALSIAGACIFSPEKLLGTLNAQQADILRLFASEQNDGIISAAHESGQTVYFWIDRSACSINCSILDDQLCYDVVISISCSIADAAGVPIEEIGTDILKKELHGQLTELITLSQQKLGGAFLGFEDAARKSDYQWYSTHSEDFAEYYRSAVIKLDITCQPERSGVFN